MPGRFGQGNKQEAIENRGDEKEQWKVCRSKELHLEERLQERRIETSGIKRNWARKGRITTRRITNI